MSPRRPRGRRTPLPCLALPRLAMPCAFMVPGSRRGTLAALGAGLALADRVERGNTEAPVTAGALGPPVAQPDALARRTRATRAAAPGRSGLPPRTGALPVPTAFQSARECAVCGCAAPPPARCTDTACPTHRAYRRSVRRRSGRSCRRRPGRCAPRDLPSTGAPRSRCRRATRRTGSSAGRHRTATASAGTPARAAVCVPTRCAHVCGRVP